jgi:hypothetical protein
MSWRPAGVTTQTLGPGGHSVYITNIKQITEPDKLAKFSAQAVFIVTCKSIDNGIEKDLILKFDGSGRDHYAGLNIERLHQAAGFDALAEGDPLNLNALMDALKGVPMMLEVNDKGFPNAIAPMEMNEETI